MISESNDGTLLANRRIALEGVSRANPNRCVTASVDASLAPSLDLGVITPSACNGPKSSVTDYVVSGATNFDDAASSVRLIVLNTRENMISLSSALMTFSAASNTRVDWEVGEGSVWIYDCATRSGAQLLRASASTGAVLNTIVMPDICRPEITVTRDAFTLTVGRGSTWTANTVLGRYRVSTGSNTVQLVARCTRGSRGITC
jgi:hypothetical protein